uniref:Putative terminase small subunit n=1 Tax=viral metagenome TaxID=1070528 RepID=A0A6M3IIT0_9ZZZZ
MPAGRPPKYDDENTLQQHIDDYFADCDNTVINKQVVQKGEIILVPTPKPYTMAGLARALEMSRETLNQYSKTDKFSDAIAQARRRIEEQNICLAMVGCYESRIAALNLSSNFGYSDRSAQEIDDKRRLEDSLDDLQEKRLKVVPGGKR